MDITFALVIVLSVMVAVLWCHKCDEHIRLDYKEKDDTFVGGNFNNRRINSDAMRGPGMGKYNTRILSPSGWTVYKPVYDEGFTSWSEVIAMQEDSFIGGCCL